jgi:hypothetical protein
MCSQSCGPLSAFVPKGLILSQRDYRTKPGVLTPGIRPKMIRPERAADTWYQRLVSLASCVSEEPILAPLQHPQPRGREVQFEPGALVQYSRTTSLCVASFRDSLSAVAFALCSRSASHWSRRRPGGGGSEARSIKTCAKAEERLRSAL